MRDKVEKRQRLFASRKVWLNLADARPGPHRRMPPCASAFID
jgi:hypothetical protein